MKTVTRICHLLSRGFETRRAWESSTAQPMTNRRNGMLRICAALTLLCVPVFPAGAHHFKGLPHYNYFENYPQVPEEEFLGQAGEYEFSLVVYDFQGINRDNVETPDKVRLFLVIFNLLDNRVYQGPLTMEILDRGQPAHTQRFERAELENIYSMHRDLPDHGRYTLRLTLHDEDDLVCEIPFLLSTQKVHWGKWIGGILVVLIGIAAVGARKARIAQDRREAHRRELKKQPAPTRPRETEREVTTGD